MLIIDDFSRGDMVRRPWQSWRGVSDRVMGGVSRERLVLDVVDGRRCLRLTGRVRLENDGGFIQMAVDLGADGATLDATAHEGLHLVVRGNMEVYSAHLRTPDNVRPWQSYRAHFLARPRWDELRLPFADFLPYRLETPLDVSRLRRLGLVAIGRAFDADLAVAEAALY